jgi:DNA-binding NarL/FixJ family response regulator
MSQWGVQLVIGKLVADDTFRQLFETRACETLARMRDQGIDLSEAEVAAFIDTNPLVWARMGSRIDPRLRPDGAGSPSSADVARAPRALTPRQRRVLRGVFEGLTNKEIAVALGVTESAVKATIQHLFRKSQVRTRTQLVRRVLEGSLGASVRPPACASGDGRL